MYTDPRHPWAPGRGRQLRPALRQVRADLRESAVGRLGRVSAVGVSRSATGWNRSGYDVTYCSNSDMIDPGPASPRQGLPQRRARRVLGSAAVRFRHGRQSGGCERAVSLRQCRLRHHALRAARRPDAPTGSSAAAGRYGGATEIENARVLQIPASPMTGPERSAADRRAQPVSVQRRRRLDRHAAGSLDVQRHGDEEGRSRSRAGRLGISRRSRRHSGPGDRGGGDRAERGHAPGALDLDDLSRAEEQFRLQRGDHLVGAGPLLAARPHAAVVALGPAARTGPRVQRITENLLTRALGKKSA